MLKRATKMLLICLALSALAGYAESHAQVTNGRVKPIREQDNIDHTRAPTEAATNLSNQPATKVLEKPDGWQLFKAPAGDFQILMPAGVKQHVDNKLGSSSTQYFQRAGDIDFLVADGSYIFPSKKAEIQQGFYQEAVNKIDQQLNKKYSSLVVREVSNITGQGWHGKQISFKTDDKDIATARIVFSNGDDVGYKLLATSGMKNDLVRVFFDSFIVDPAIASKAHLSTTNSAPVRNFVGFIWPISVVVLGAVVVSFVVSAFVNRKR